MASSCGLAFLIRYYFSDAPVMFVRPGGAARNSRTLNLTGPLASSPRDLLFAVTDRPKHLIALRSWWAAKEGLAKKRVHVFPDDLSFFGNFKETAEGGLSDQCVAVRQALSVAHARREKIPSGLVL